MKKSVLLSALALTATMFAGVDVSTPQKMRDKKVMKEAEVSLGLPSAQAPTEGDVTVSVAGICMQVGADAPSWGKTNAAEIVKGPNSGEYSVYTYKNLEDKRLWIPGFEVQLGVNLDNDLDLQLNYRWLHAKNKKETVESAANYQFPTPFVQQVTSASRERSFHHDWFSLNVGRDSLMGSNWSFRPHMGIAFGWQKAEGETILKGQVADTDPAKPLVGGSLTETSKSNLQLVGPAIGMTNMLNFVSWDSECSDGVVGLFCDFEFTPLFAHVEKTLEQVAVPDGDKRDPTGAFKNDSSAKQNLLVPVLNTNTGLRYSTLFNNKKNSLGVEIGWKTAFQMGAYRISSGEQTNADPKSGPGLRFKVRDLVESLGMQGVHLMLSFGF